MLSNISNINAYNHKFSDNIYISYSYIDFFFLAYFDMHGVCMTDLKRYDVIIVTNDCVRTTCAISIDQCATNAVILHTYRSLYTDTFMIFT